MKKKGLIIIIILAILLIGVSIFINVKVKQAQTVEAKEYRRLNNLPEPTLRDILFGKKSRIVPPKKAPTLTDEANGGAGKNGSKSGSGTGSGTGNGTNNGGTGAGGSIFDNINSSNGTNSGTGTGINGNPNRPYTPPIVDPDITITDPDEPPIIDPYIDPKINVRADPCANNSCATKDNKFVGRGKTKFECPPDQPAKCDQMAYLVRAFMRIAPELATEDTIKTTKGEISVLTAARRYADYLTKQVYDQTRAYYEPIKVFAAAWATRDWSPSFNQDDFKFVARRLPNGTHFDQPRELITGIDANGNYEKTTVQMFPIKVLPGGFGNTNTACNGKFRPWTTNLPATDHNIMQCEMIHKDSLGNEFIPEVWLEQVLNIY